MKSQWKIAGGWVLVWACFLGTMCRGAEPEPWKQASTLAAPEAYQAAAADETFIYAITDSKVAKYDRKTGQRLGVSVGKAHHLNSGFLWQGRLYCAHSNYPELPEKSEIMVLDIESMRLSTFKDFGNFGGSLTWAVRHQGHWWCNFAKYDADNGQTFLVKFDEGWNEKGRWTYPTELIGKLGKWSLSGGLWHDGLLVVTGHNGRVLFRLRVPGEGKVLEWVDQQPAPFTGQGIAEDPKTGGLVGIDRAKRVVVFAERER